MDESSWAAGHGSAGWPSPGALVLSFPADNITGSTNRPIKADCAKVKTHLKWRIPRAPLLAPRQLRTDVPNRGTAQDTVPGGWSVVRGDELSQRGCSCCIPAEMVTSFSCKMQSVRWLVQFRFINLLLLPTELLVFIRLSFRCYEDMPASTLGK